MTSPTLVMHSNIILIIIVAVIVSSISSARYLEADFDPYEVLGVSSTASQSEIQQAYRTLARRKHPDRNTDDPNANEVFTRINKAYDILSDPAKRQHFDNNGKASTTPPSSDWSDFHHLELEIIRRNELEQLITTESFERPTIVLTLTRSCNKNCATLAGWLKKTAGYLEASGVRLVAAYVDDRDNTGQLLNVYTTATILAIINGRVITLFISDTDDGLLLSFSNLNNQLFDGINVPLDEITDKTALAKFLDSFKDGRIRVLITLSANIDRNFNAAFKHTAVKVAALKYRHLAKFGLAMSPVIDHVTRSVANSHNLAIFDETFKTTKSPKFSHNFLVSNLVNELGAKTVTKIIETSMETHSFLTVPVITSKQLFKRLCSTKQGETFICVMLIVERNEKNVDEEETLGQFLNISRTINHASSTLKNYYYRFCYIRAFHQNVFVRHLLRHASSSPENDHVMDVVIFQNNAGDGGMFTFKHLPSSFDSSDGGKKLESFKSLLLSVGGTQLLDKVSPDLIVDEVQETTTVSSSMRQQLDGIKVAVLKMIEKLRRYGGAFPTTASYVLAGAVAWITLMFLRHFSQTSSPTVRRWSIARIEEHCPAADTMPLLDFCLKISQFDWSAKGKNEFDVVFCSTAPLSELRNKRAAETFVRMMPHLGNFDFYRLDFSSDDTLTVLCRLFNKAADLDAHLDGSVLVVDKHREFYYRFSPGGGDRQRLTMSSTSINNSKTRQATTCSVNYELLSWLEDLLDGNLEPVNISGRWPSPKLRPRSLTK